MRTVKLAIVFAAAAFAGINPAFATDVDITTTVATSPAIDPTVSTRALVNLSTSALPSYASYTVTLTPYTASSGETFSPVYFQATTTVVDGSGAAVAGQVAAFDFLGAVLPSPGSDCTVTNVSISATSTIQCKLPFALVTSGGANSFTLTVKAPTAGASIKFVSETRWFEGAFPHSCGPAPLGNFPPLSGDCLETEGAKPAIYLDLLSPTANPTIAQTVLPFPTGGTVTTGTGAATCDNPWVVSVTVPTSATVSLNTNPTRDSVDTGGTCTSAAGDCQYFAKLKIPLTASLPFTDPLRITLRRDRCTIEGRGIIGKALQIFEESIFYRSSDVTNDGSYNKVVSCLIQGGPVPGMPCIRSRGIYTIFNLPNVPDKLKYLGDHFWNIEATENGRYGTP